MFERRENNEPRKATNRAIGLDVASVTELKAVLDEYYENILSWLQNKEWDFVERARINLEAQLRANANASHKAHRFDLRIASWKGPKFFNTRSEGELVVVRA